MLEVDFLCNPIDAHSADLMIGRPAHASYRQDSGSGTFTQIIDRNKMLPVPVLIERPRVP